MKIAFVGKGGSGKSTITALFTRYIQQQKHNILAIDADLNMNLAGLLGVSFPVEKVLARPAIADSIRTHLKGDNSRIADISKFLPTTPPGAGSNIIQQHNDAALDFCAVDADDKTRLLTVGTYDGDGIGQTCYHSHLFVAENLLSHIQARDFDVVCDMVAGTDAFAYSLHLQFDAIVLIAEPTPESAEVCALYLDLAKQAGIEGLVHLVANKIEDEDDLDFIFERTGMTPIGHIPLMSDLKKSRQRGGAVTQNMLTPDLTKLMHNINSKARAPAISEAVRFDHLRQLHTTLNGKQWVKLAYGDVLEQIDPNFDIETAA